MKETFPEDLRSAALFRKPRLSLESSPFLVQAGHLVFGAAVPFAEIINEFRREVDDVAVPEAHLNMAAHIERIAGAPNCAPEESSLCQILLWKRLRFVHARSN